MTAFTSDFIETLDLRPRKGNLKSYLVFGASGDIGGNAAKVITQQAPDALLRLVTSSEKKVAVLQAEFPDAEVVVADYLDYPSIEKAFKGIEGVLLVITDFLDEWVAMGNVVYACKKWCQVKHVIRIIGEAPGMRLKFVPEIIRNRPGRWGGPIAGHPRAREILTNAGLPVTYLNMAAWLMKNLLKDSTWKPCIEQLKYFCMPYDHPTPLIDSREVGEVAGKLLVSDDHRHIHHTYDLDNGHDWVTNQELSKIVAEELNIDLGFVGHDLEEYERIVSQHPVKRFGVGMMEYSGYEWEFAPWFYLSDTLERLLGRKPLTMREWLREHGDQFDLSAYK